MERKLPTGVYRRTGTRMLWVTYYHRGRPFQESARTESPRDAAKFRARRLAALQAGTFVGPQQERVTVAQVLEAYLENRKLAGTRDQKTMRGRCAHLTRELGWMRAVDVTLPGLERWANQQLTRYSRGTVKIDLAYLRAAFRTARRQGVIAYQPEFPSIAVDNARQGFFEPHEFEAVRAAILTGSPHGQMLADVVAFGYHSGWRLREILDMPWSEVDHRAKVIRLAANRTKTGKGRVLALTGELEAVITRRWKARVIGKPDDEQLIARVFHRNGKPVQDFRWAWRQACAAAGVQRIFHDFRRTAVRNLTAAGVERTVAKSITGHVSDQVFDRYNIKTVDDQRRALERLASTRPSNVVPLQSPGQAAVAVAVSTP